MKGSSLGFAAIALVFGVGLGLLVGKGAPGGDPCLAAGDHFIDVGLNSSLSCPTATIRRGTANRVLWRAPSGTLTIRFASAPASVPQPVCGPPNYTDNICVLGPVDGTVPPSPPAGYPYEVRIVGASAAASTAYTTSPTARPTNGRIIIQK